jgi:hypothetical protein
MFTSCNVDSLEVWNIGLILICVLVLICCCVRVIEKVRIHVSVSDLYLRCVAQFIDSVYYIDRNLHHEVQVCL